MSKSYTQLRSDYGTDTKNTASANLTFGTVVMNDFLRRLYSKADWPFIHRLRTATTVASTTFVNLPYDIDQVESIFVTVSNTRYTPRPAPSRQFWDELHYSIQTSDTPEYWFVYNGQLGLWPRPSTAGNTISINGKIRVSDLSIADYTTGTISAVTNADETITGASTVWTTKMVGRYLRVTELDGASTGDGLWYEIASRTSDTELELVRKYGGVTFTGGSAAYTIGQMPLLPEAFHDLPELYAAYRYWAKEDQKRANTFKEMLVDGLDTLFKTHSLNNLSMVIDSGDDEAELINPNLILNL